MLLVTTSLSVLLRHSTPCVAFRCRYTDISNTSPHPKTRPDLPDKGSPQDSACNLAVHIVNHYVGANTYCLKAIYFEHLRYRKPTAEIHPFNECTRWNHLFPGKALLMTLQTRQRNTEAKRNTPRATRIRRQFRVTPDEASVNVKSGQESIDESGQVNVVNIIDHTKDNTSNSEYSNFRILLIDDDGDFLMIAQCFFNNLGFDVECCASAEEAIEAFKTQRYDIVFSDWLMPGMNGLELCSHLRDEMNADEIVFYLCTAYGSPDAITNAFRAGVDGFIDKPINEITLKSGLLRACKTLKLRRDRTFAFQI